jgi:3-oxoacyl-[acyl-carrier-protein] synthase I
MEEAIRIHRRMTNIFIASDNIITSLGFTTVENIRRIKACETGIRRWVDESLAPLPFWASRVDDEELNELFSALAHPDDYTRFEKMVICSVKDALRNAGIDQHSARTRFIISSTKGNIDLLNPVINRFGDGNRVYLWKTAALMKRFFGLAETPIVVSNACISGILAVICAARMIRLGLYDHVVVTGADLVTEFVLSGFNSFLSLSDGPCKPFDKYRQGLSLGEGAGTIVLTTDPSLTNKSSGIRIGHGFSSNDANHISGPSRNGEGLFQVIRKTIDKNNLPVDYISAHGTATPYNDEMESIAISRAELQDVPVNSFKGYWGHTLGAAGILEIIAGACSLSENLLFGTLGYSEPGTTHPLAVIRETREARLNTCLKIASGFGGCNAALLISK